MTVQTVDVRAHVHDAARRARTASRVLATLTTEVKNRALHAAADAVRPAGGRILGSKLWLLQRGKTTLATLRLAEQACVDALRWLIDLKIAAEVKVLAERPQLGTLQLNIKITRPQKLLPPFERLWKVRTNALL